MTKVDKSFNGCHKMHLSVNKPQRTFRHQYLIVFYLISVYEMVTDL